MKKFLLILLSAYMTNVWAQITTENLGSKSLDGTRKVTIVLPDGYDKRERYPLFVVLNASSLLEPTVSSMRYFNKTVEVSIILRVMLLSQRKPESLSMTPPISLNL